MNRLFAPSASVHALLSLYATSQYPDGNNPEVLRIQRANLDNSAVSIYPSFSPIGINGGFYYGRANFKF